MMSNATLPASGSRLPLWPGTPPFSCASDGFEPWLETYLVESDGPRGAVVVLPGGGYVGRADHEAEPIARMINKHGLHAFVAHYRVSPHRHPAPLLDACRAIRIVRQNAEAWGVLADKVAILGFSAGGHLAGSVGLLHREANSGLQDEIAEQKARPDAMVLCYPVLTSGNCGHRGSMEALLGPGPDPEQLSAMSLEHRVTQDAPPAFLWHTADDAVVPVENSLLFAQALSEHDIPYELHVYPSGPHGMGLAERDPHVASWTRLCGEWLKGMGW